MMLITKISRGRREKAFYSCQCKIGQFSSFFFFFFFLFSKMPQPALWLLLEKQGLNYWRTFALVVEEQICLFPLALMQEMFPVINEDVLAFQQERKLRRYLISSDLV